MKVLYVQKRAHPNAAGILAGLRDAGHDVRHLVFTREPATDPMLTSVPFYAVFDCIRSARKRARLAVPRIRPVLRLLRTFRPDVIILKTFRVHSAVVGALAAANGSRLVLLSDRPHGRGKGFDRWFGRLAPRRRIHAGWEGKPGEEVPSWGGRASLTLPYPAPLSPTPRFHDDAPEPRMPVRLLVVTNFTNPAKQPELVSHALRDSGVAHLAHVTFIGTGAADSPVIAAIRSIEQASGLAASDILLDVPHEEVLARYAEYDLLVMPSRREGFSVVVVEAVAAGLGVICGVRNGARNCVIHEESGYVIDMSDSTELARVFAELLPRPERIRELGLAARDVRLDLSPEAWVSAFERLVLSPPPARRSWPASSTTSP